MNFPKILISGSYNTFNEGWDGCGVYMASGLYVSETFKLPIYIGSSVNLQSRIELNHISNLNRNKHPHNPPLQFAWNKHAEKEGFVWWLLEVCIEEDVLVFEQKYLDLYRPFVDEFGGFNINHSSTAGKGNFGELNGMFGKNHTEEAKKKISEANKGKCAKEKHHLFGKHQKEETKRKASDTVKEKYRNGYINPNKGKTFSGLLQVNRIRAVKCRETNIIYPSISEAARKCYPDVKTAIAVNGIGKAIREKASKVYKELHWEYVKNEPNER